MTTLIITRGLPASGKTTFAKAWVAQSPDSRARVNRDDLRAMVHDGEYVKGVTEPRIVTARDALVSSLLRKGVDVVVDDTNLPQRVARDLARLARRAGAEVRVEDFTHVALEVCIERDAARARAVGEQVIRDMHTRYLKGRALPLPPPEETEASEQPPGAGWRYKPAPGTPKAVMVDIDGTTALMCDRSPFDETRVHQDLPNPPVIAAIRAMHAAGYQIVFVSGRTDACRAETEKWLREHVGVVYAGLHMRAAGDFRKDYQVKAELFRRWVADWYDIAFVLDDRKQVVDMWRAAGLTVLQVAEGDF